MTYLSSNIPHFKCWVRKEFTHNHIAYEGEYLHALAIAVNTIPDRSLSFNVVFTGCDEEENIHGGAMWARMPIAGEGAPDFAPSQYIHSAEIHDSYMNPYLTFNNLYQDEETENEED
jgi:hypothetical protein